ncbi:FecCD family ABC transporter permease [Caldalkalibacillus salinus]|uniref:FecCD family ABC transporter permease n=1 Tax=Caldalkalibacillus salinus TaxID=2803787 RepID=UPI0019214834|nr:iron ABC transporter permease [Caldalkalibacillus salinus]
MQQSFIQKYSANKLIGLYLFCGGFVLGTALLGLSVSSVYIPIPMILQVLDSKLLGVSSATPVPANVEAIIWDIRLPRVLLATIVGAALALAGAAFQGLLRNPLADPYTIGVSSGAALGAVSVLFFQFTLFGLGTFTLPVVAIVGGLLALMLVYGLTRFVSPTLSVETLILAGIIMSSFISAIIALVIALSGEELRQILFWLMGNLGMRKWPYVQLVFPFFIVGTVLLLMHTRELNALSMGEEAAQNIGVAVQEKKRWILLGAALLTGACVAVSGMIGFVGLVIPHLVRLVVGPNHKHVLPLSLLVGASFLTLADLISRTVIAPQELPIGVITALIGAPVFALLLYREKVVRTNHE